jgi:hypothetical protein
MATGGPDPRSLDPGIGLVLEELRDLRLEMHEDRRRADGERRQADVARQAEQRRSDERFERMMREFRQDSARREAATQKAFREIRTVGLSIVKTLNQHTRLLNHHTRLLERIDDKLGAWGRGRPGPANGGGAPPRK